VRADNAEDRGVQLEQSAEASPVLLSGVDETATAKKVPRSRLDTNDAWTPGVGCRNWSNMIVYNDACQADLNRSETVAMFGVVRGTHYDEPVR
jgi:hypothetical protein